MRSMIKKCQDKVATIKEELRKKQAQLMQIRQNNIFNSNIDSNQTANVNNYYNQQMISNNERTFNHNNLVNNKFDNLEQSINNNSNLQNILQNNKRSNCPQKHQQQYQTQQQQQMLQQHQQNQQQHQQQSQIPQQQQPQQQYSQKSNTMLMTMLSDVPAANSQLSLTNNSNPNNYFIQQQQQLNLNNNPIQNPQQPKLKKQQRAKRKGQDSTSKSPKRKMSEDEFSSRDLPTPGSDYMENSYENYQSFSNQISRPSSNASSSNYLILT